jgi:hypothetical protein
MVVAWSRGEYGKVIRWLSAIGCRVEISEWQSAGPGQPHARIASYRVIGTTGIVCGIAQGMSAIDALPQFGFMVAGPQWPHFFPELYRAVDCLLKGVEWKPRRAKPTLLEDVADNGDPEPESEQPQVDKVDFYQ